MNNPTEKYSVTQYTVNSVLSFIDSGDIAIPEIQRPYSQETNLMPDCMVII